MRTADHCGELVSVPRGVCALRICLTLVPESALESHGQEWRHVRLPENAVGWRPITHRGAADARLYSTDGHLAVHAREQSGRRQEADSRHAAGVGCVGSHPLGGGGVYRLVLGCQAVPLPSPAIRARA
jgi:hypothetical protein